MSEHHQEGVPHRHPLRPDQDDTLTYWRAMEIALRQLLIEKQITTADEVRREVEAMDNRSPAHGAQVVARAWTDPQFRELLLSDGNAACEALGFERGLYKLIAVENTDKVHNVVVCTLCSCYPRFLLGLPPDWYKSRNYRSRMVNSPREVLREFGTTVADDVVVRVHDSNADMRYLVVPKRPAGTDGWSEAQLAELVTRDAMIGVAMACQP
ncbi:MAG: nitrile hydratase subunit alpha [Betaproteobacteria bacterium]|nr:MAG: nitrile hydratase subunit alpha [Betaproteobacteria bacterium]